MDPNRLKQIPIFSRLSDEEANRLAAFATETSVAEGQILMKQGDYSTELIAIEEGSADVIQDGEKIASLKVSGTTKDGKPRTRQDFMDSVVPNFGVRCTSTGQRTYILAARFPGSKNYTRREIEDVGAIGLADAREKARGWLQIIGRGKDPAHEEERLARAEAKKRENTFDSVAESFIAEWVIGPKPDKPRQRKHKVVARAIRKYLIEKWGKRPIADIERGEVVDLIKAKAKDTPAEARNLLGIAKALFSWALNQNYGLSHSICTDIKPGQIVGEKISRDHALDDDELKALWIAVGDMGVDEVAELQICQLRGHLKHLLARREVVADL